MGALWLMLLLVVSAVLVVVGTRRARSMVNKAGPTYPPRLEAYPLIGHLPQFLANRHRVLDWMTEALERQTTGTLVLRWPGGVRGVVTANTANVEHFLRTSFDHYDKGGPRIASVLHDLVGRAGFFVAEGEAWRAQRKVASHEFNTRSFRAFVARCVHTELHGRLLPLLRRAAASGASLDLEDALERFAFDNICSVAFGHDPSQLQLQYAYTADDSNFPYAFSGAADLSVGRFLYAVRWFWKVKKALNVGSERRLRENIAVVRDFADRIIQSRRESFDVDGKHDLLSRFMEASQDEDETTDSKLDVPLRDMVISFLIAGRDSTSSALAWFFWLLSSRPDVQRRIRDEIAAVRARRALQAGGDVDTSVAGFDLDDLREMHYLHAAITESMRLYPPVPLSLRRAEKDDVLPDGTAVRAGWFVAYNSYAMGRMEAVWGDDAREYRPERWLNRGDGTFRPDSPYRFVVFHAGPRTCLGKDMAYIQMKSIVACVLEELQLEVDAAYQPRQLASLTLKMADGLPVTVKPRRDHRRAVVNNFQESKLYTITTASAPTPKLC